MTHQEFNNIYYQYTNSERGIRPYDRLRMRGDELQEFVEFAVQKILINRSNQTQLNFDD